MSDIATFLMNYYKAEPSEKLLKLMIDSEEITGKPYYVLVEELFGDQLSASISTDNEKHTITLPKQTLQQVDDVEVVEILIAHEILHTQLETRGFILRPFNESWRNLVYNIIVDLIINRVELPRYNFNYSKCVYQFNLKTIDVSAKYGFRVPILGNDYEKVLIIIGTLLNCRWFWNRTHPKVRQILKVLKQKYTGSALGDIYDIMSDRLHNIENLCSHDSTYEIATTLTNDIEEIFRRKKISFTIKDRSRSQHL